VIGGASTTGGGSGGRRLDGGFDRRLGERVDHGVHVGRGRRSRRRSSGRRRRFGGGGLRGGGGLVGEDGVDVVLIIALAFNVGLIGLIAEREVVCGVDQGQDHRRPHIKAA